MKRTLYILVVLPLIAALALSVGPARFSSSSQSNVVTVTGTSTLHDWKMVGPTIRGTIALEEVLATELTAQSWKAAAANPPMVSVTIPISSIRSEHGRMDKLMQQALKAETHPEITYQLVEASIQEVDDASFTLRTRGNLTIAGVTRDLDMTVKGNRPSQNLYTLKGEAPIRMTDFGIKPPTAMMGTIKTGDEVKVSFSWTVERTN